MGYLDPNIFGIVSQVGFVIFFGITTIFVFFSKTLRATFGQLFRVLLRRQEPILQEEEESR